MEAWKRLMKKRCSTVRDILTFCCWKGQTANTGSPNISSSKCRQSPYLSLKCSKPPVKITPMAHYFRKLLKPHAGWIIIPKMSELYVENWWSAPLISQEMMKTMREIFLNQRLKKFYCSIVTSSFRKSNCTFLFLKCNQSSIWSLLGLWRQRMNVKLLLKNISNHSAEEGGWRERDGNRFNNNWEQSQASLLSLSSYESGHTIYKEGIH